MTRESIPECRWRYEFWAVNKDRFPILSTIASIVNDLCFYKKITFLAFSWSKRLNVGVRKNIFDRDSIPEQAAKCSPCGNCGILYQIRHFRWFHKIFRDFLTIFDNTLTAFYILIKLRKRKMVKNKNEKTGQSGQKNNGANGAHGTGRDMMTRK